jgi:hypothetical protein
MPEPTVQQRIVPGAPPPAHSSKSHRKKRKAKKADDDTTPDDQAPATQQEKSPEPVDSSQPTPAPDTSSEVPAAPEEDVKSSPIVELITKRLKATSKKIVCHHLSPIHNLLTLLFRPVLPSMLILTPKN